MSVTRVLVKLIQYEGNQKDNCDVYFDCDCLWSIEKDGDLYLYKDVDDERDYLATFPSDEWRYIRRIDDYEQA